MAPRIINLVLDGGVLSALRSDRFTVKERTPLMHWIGDSWTSELVRTLWRRKESLPCLCQDLNPVFPLPVKFQPKSNCIDRAI